MDFLESIEQSLLGHEIKNEETGAVKLVGISNEDYHADKSIISSSALKEILRSPEHYRHYADHQKEETDAMAYGTAIHTIVLEPDEFTNRYVLLPEFSAKRTTKAGKEEYEVFMAQHEGKLPLAQAEWDALHQIREKVMTHKMAAALIKRGESEASIYWTDKETGLRLKIRPDSQSSYGILDVKSTVDASSQAFSRVCVNLKYDLQAAMYVDGMRELTGDTLEFCFLAIEKTAPFGVKLYSVPPEMMESGIRKYRMALDLMKQCLESRSWPGYQPEGMMEELSWPRWAF